MSEINEEIERAVFAHAEFMKQRRRKIPGLQFCVDQYRHAIRNNEIHGSETAYYEGVMWALRVVYAQINDGCDTLEIDASPDAP